MRTRLSILSVFLLAAIAFAKTPRPLANVLISKADGTKIDLKKLHGKVVLVAFLTTTCDDCAQSVAVLNNIKRDLGPRGFEVVGVVVDDGAQVLVNSFTERYRPDFPVGYLDRADFIKLADIPPGMRPFVPVFMFINRQGLVHSQYYGDHELFKTEDKSTRSIVQNLLRQPAAPSAK